jgi:hypothetical protein
MLAARIALFYAVSLGAAWAHWAVLRATSAAGRGAPRGLSLVFLGAVVLAAPLVVPGDERVLRFFFAVQNFSIIAKMHDLGEPRSKLPDAQRFAVFLFNPTSFVYRKLDAEPSPSARSNAKRIVRGVAQAAIGGAAFALAWRLHLEQVSFALEHVAKLVAFYVASLGAIGALVAFWRLLFGKARDPMQDIFTAPTPAVLWRRYNRTVGQFFYEDLFPRFGGLRRPVRATLLVFAFSSLVHEYVFGVAIGAVQGWQTAFFMLQGVAVAATLRARPRGAARVAAMLGTLAFNATSSVLFFVSLQQVVPFWADLPWRR